LVRLVRLLWLLRLLGLRMTVRLRSVPICLRLWLLISRISIVRLICRLLVQIWVLLSTLGWSTRWLLGLVIVVARLRWLLIRHFPQ